MIYLLISVGIGAGIGAAMGYFGRCSSGACPLTATWHRGALFGGLTGLLFFLSSGEGLGGRGKEVFYDPNSPVKAIGEQDFEAEVQQAKLPVLIDFYATWCGPCRRMAPQLDAVAREFEGRIKFVKVNIDEAPKLAQRFEVQAVPTLVWQTQGQVREVIVGGQTADQIRSRLAAGLAQGGTTAR